MKKTVFLLIVCLIPTQVFAWRGNTPCSGKKRGIAHCSGTHFVCKNGASANQKEPVNYQNHTRPKNSKLAVIGRILAVHGQWPFNNIIENNWLFASTEDSNPSLSAI